MTNSEAAKPVTLRTLSEDRRRAWNALESLENALATYDSPALRAAIDDKRAEYKRLSRQIDKGVKILAARHAND